MKTCLTFILMLLPVLIKAQEVRFQHLNVNNGLSQNSITAMIQDSQGFIWFGTEYGLNKYDGYKVETFVPQGGKTGTIAGNQVWSLLEDSKGRIWVGTNEGINIFDKNKYSFQQLKAETEEGEKLKGSVGYILEDENGEFWFGTFTHGLYKFDEHQNTLIHYNVTQVDQQESKISYRIWDIFIDKNQILWASTWDKGLIRLNTRDGSFKFLNGINSNLKSDHLGNIVTRSDSTVWIGTRNGVQILNLFTGEISQTANEGLNSISFAHDILRDGKGRLWVGSYGRGLFVYDKELNALDHFHQQEENPHSLSINLVMDLMEDRSGCIWAGTWTGGANKYCPGAVKFECCHQQYDIENVFAIEGDERYLLLGTLGDGAYLIDKKTRVVEKIRNDSKTSNDIVDELVIAIEKSNDDEYWFGYQGSGFSRLNLRSREFEFYTSENSGLNYDVVTSILTTDKNNIWLGTSGGGVNLFNPEENTFRYFTTQSTPSISSNSISTLMKDSHDNIWIGTQDGGVNILEASLEKVTQYRSFPDSSNTLSSNNIWDIWEDRDGIIWVATSFGLNSLNPETGEIDRFTEADGLGHNWVYSILGDKSGRLWLSTNGGLTVFDLAENTFRNFDVQDGLQGNEFNANAKFMGKDGRMLFGGINGFNAFYPNGISVNTREPQIVFTGLEILNKPVPISEEKSDTFAIPKHISQLEELVLTHKQQVFSLEFAALHYVNPQKNRYQYKLEGFDDNWIEANQRHYVTYTNLDPGNYTFRVRGSNNDGFWSSKEATLPIKVLHPPWKTWWAYLLYSGLIFGGLFLTIRTILVRQRLKNDLKIEQVELQKAQELDQIKSRFFESISHEFRTPLTLITAPIKKLIKKEGKDEEEKNTLRLVQRNAGRLLDLINQLLELSKLEAGKLNLNVTKADINGFLRMIAASFQSLSDNRQITFIPHISGEEHLIYFDKEKIEQIVTNLLSNAFKFTSSGGKVGFEVSSTDQYLQIVVSDDGKGISKDELKHIFERFYQIQSTGGRSSGGSGIGLALVKELTELHHGTISVESKKRTNTTFTIKIPVQESAYSPEEIDAEKHTVPKITQSVSTTTPRATADQPDEENKDEPLVLVVEDNKDLREYIGSTLSELYEVERAKNGFEGLEKAALIPDLILTDLMMPEMDGLKMLRRLKSDPKTNHIPLIMLTAKADRESRLKGLDIGADHYVNKPFDMEELLIRVHSLIKQRDRIRKHYRREFISNPAADNILSADDRFLQRAMDVLKQNLAEPSFTVEQFADELAMSRVQLHRKLKAVLGCSATEFIREVRLKKAYKYLKENKGTVTEIAYEVGFNNLSYFSKCFRETFDVNPSELLP